MQLFIVGSIGLHSCISHIEHVLFLQYRDIIIVGPTTQRGIESEQLKQYPPPQGLRFVITPIDYDDDILLLQTSSQPIPVLSSTQKLPRTWLPPIEPRSRSPGIIQKLNDPFPCSTAGEFFV